MSKIIPLYIKKQNIIVKHLRSRGFKPVIKEDKRVIDITFHTKKYGFLIVIFIDKRPNKWIEWSGNLSAFRKVSMQNLLYYTFSSVKLEKIILDGYYFKEVK